MKINKKTVLRFFLVFLCGFLLNVVIFFDLFKYQYFYWSTAKQYDGEVDSQVYQEQVLKGMVAGLGDQYTYYMTDEEYSGFQTELGVEFKGIGVVFYYDKHPVVADILEDSPAAGTQLLPGDNIIKINDKATEELDNESFLQEISQAEDQIQLTVYRPSTDSEYNVSVTKAPITTPTISASVIEDNNKKYGMIDIDTFGENTDEEFTDYLKQFEEKEISGLIIDLRDNPGGLSITAERIADLLIPGTKPLYITKFKDEIIDEPYVSQLKTAKDYPIAVLVNENTASAAEILTGGFKEINESQIIGTKTYGKGSVQTLMPTIFGGALRITTAHWYSPDENIINEQGITPTIEMSDKLPVVLPVYLETELASGDTSVQVKQLHENLKMLGYNVDPQNANFTEVTKTALINFQTANFLSATGKLDAETNFILYKKALEASKLPANDAYVQRALSELEK